MSEQDVDRLSRLAAMTPLDETLQDREGGEYFANDLAEARALAELDPRFRPLAEGLAQPSLGARMKAIDKFFEGVPLVELSALKLPPHLAQLRQVFLSTRSG
jgi:hypothetical protein